MKGNTHRLAFATESKLSELNVAVTGVFGLEFLHRGADGLYAKNLSFGQIANKAIRSLTSICAYIKDHC